MREFRMALHHTLTIVVLIAAAISPVMADEPPTIPVVPAHTKVLLLPALDETGDRAEMQRQHIATANHRLEYEFLIRAFPMISPDEAVRAARKEDLDIDDPEERGKKTLRSLGKATGADWVVSVAVISVRKEDKGGLFFNSRRGKAKVQIRIYDVNSEQWVTNRFYEDTKTSTRAFGSIGTTGLFREAIDTTTQRCVHNILTQYPITVKIADEYGEKDLLTGRNNGAPTPATPNGDAAPAGNVTSSSDAATSVADTPANTETPAPDAKAGGKK